MRGPGNFPSLCLCAAPLLQAAPQTRDASVEAQTGAETLREGLMFSG